MTKNKILGIFLAGIMLCGSIPLGFAEPLRVQLEQGIETEQIKCDNPNHTLVERTNGELACVTEKSAEKMNWEIIPVSNNLILNKVNYDDVSKINDMSKSFSSVSPNPVKYYDGEITLDKIPILNEITSFNITIESSAFVQENIDELLIEAQQFLESNPQDLPQYFTFQLKYPSSFNLEFSNTSNANITKEQSGDLMYATFEFPISLDKEYILTPQEITGTLQPTQEGFFKLNLDQKSKYKKIDSNDVVIDTGIKFEYLADKYLYIDLTDSFVPEYFLTINKIDSTKELTVKVPVDYNIIESEVISRFSDELKSKVTIIDGQIGDVSDEEARWQILDLFDEVDREYPVFERVATFEDMPDNPDMIAKMPKTQNFTVNLDYPENISNGDIFEITFNLISYDLENDYQQIEYITILGNGLHLVKEPAPYNDIDIENAKNGIQCRGGYIKTVCTQGEPYTLPPKTVLVPNNLPNIHYQSITPDDNGQISYTVLVKALEKGEWMFKAIVNDQVYRNKIMVN